MSVDPTSLTKPADLPELKVPLAPTACDFELSGPEGFVESSQISGETRVLQTEAVDCRWHIRAPPRSKVGASAPAIAVHPHAASVSTQRCLKKVTWDQRAGPEAPLTLLMF